MRFATIIAAFSAAAVVSAAAGSGHVDMEGGQHLRLLTKKSSDDAAVHHAGGGSSALKAKRQQQQLHSGMAKRSNMKIKKRAAGYCKAKASAAVPADTSSKNSEPTSSSSSSKQQDQAPSSTSSSKQAESTPDKGSDNNNNDNNNDNSGNSGNSNGGTASANLGSISAFQGTNSGIMSWFKTNLGSDSTNGESWCQTKYKDDWMCFAPSVGTMLRNFGGDYNKAAKAYCGREVKVTYNGKSTNAFICDGFDDRWVLSAGSIDATVGLFTAVYGSFDNNKNTVGKGVQWEFTGGVVQQGTFKNGKTY